MWGLGFRVLGFSSIGGTAFGSHCPINCVKKAEFRIGIWRVELVLVVWKPRYPNLQTPNSKRRCLRYNPDNNSGMGALHTRCGNLPK